MIARILVAALLVGPPTPQPSPSLPEIGRVRSNAVCSVLRQNVAPALVGLSKNDELIGAGHRALLKTGHDSGGTSSAAVELDMLYLEQVETRLVHNLGAVDRILSDPARFPAHPHTPDDRTAVELKARLTAVADGQRKALDLVSGVLDTESLGRLQHELDDGMQSATGDPAGPHPAATATPVAFLGTAGLPEHELPGIPTTQEKLSTLAGHTPYDSVAAGLEERQSAVAAEEHAASNAVVAAVAICRDGAPAPAVPEPTPSPGFSPVSFPLPPR